jgi:hypothetical protein
MLVKVIHIYKEGNHCANKIVNIGISGTWHDMPNMIKDNFNIHNKLGLFLY